MHNKKNAHCHLRGVLSSGSPKSTRSELSRWDQAERACAVGGMGGEEKIDVLLSHCPPRGILGQNAVSEHKGCVASCEKYRKRTFAPVSTFSDTSILGTEHTGKHRWSHLCERGYGFRFLRPQPDTIRVPLEPTPTTRDLI